MGYKGELVKIGERNIYLIKGIYDYFDKNNFSRLEEADKEAKKSKAELFVGLYSDKILEKVNIQRNLKGLVSDEDRIETLECLDFVKGAFKIDSIKEEDIDRALKARLFEKEYENEQEKNENVEKKYDIGYASGAFTKFHKGHREHLQEMSEQCKTIIIAVNSDDLIRNYKHKEPSVDQKTRRKIVSHMKYVDMAIITDEYDKIKAIEKVKDLCGKEFNAIFAGSDWKGNPKWESFEKKLNGMGIDVVFTDRPENGISTTKIDKKNIKNNDKDRDRDER